MEKVSNMQEQMRNRSRECKKESKRNVRNKKRRNGNEESADWTQPKKEPAHWASRHVMRNFSNWDAKRNKNSNKQKPKITPPTTQKKKKKNPRTTVQFQEMFTSRNRLGQERGQAAEIFEVVTADNFPKLTTDTKVQIQEAWRTPNRTESPKPTPGMPHSSCRNPKTKESLEAAEGGRTGEQPLCLQSKEHRAQLIQNHASKKRVELTML